MMGQMMIHWMQNADTPTPIKMLSSFSPAEAKSAANRTQMYLDDENVQLEMIEYDLHLMKNIPMLVKLKIAIKDVQEEYQVPQVSLN